MRSNTVERRRRRECQRSSLPVLRPVQCPSLRSPMELGNGGSEAVGGPFGQGNGSVNTARRGEEFEEASLAIKLALSREDLIHSAPTDCCVQNVRI
jgi:hypothetical protein